jgi:ATP-binding cassette subfamily B protein
VLVLIFDEATSALDSATEKQIQKSLAEVAKGKTTVVIAHRLSTIVDADQIIVLKGERTKSGIFCMR